VKVVLTELHGGPSGGHLGINKALNKVQQGYYWLQQHFSGSPSPGILAAHKNPGNTHVFHMLHYSGLSEEKGNIIAAKKLTIHNELQASV
jgi:hypothetical protein